MASDRSFLNEVASQLTKSGFEFLIQPGIGGLIPDFLVKLPGGTYAIVEVKHWTPTKENQLRAIRQAEFLRMQTGVSSSFIVLRNLKQGRPAVGLVSERELLWTLAERSYDPPTLGWRRLDFLRNAPKKRIIFAAMPFSAKYDDTFFVGIVGAAKSIDAVAKRVDNEEFVGDIVAEIKTPIHESAAVVADLSESKPNVLYETGYAHGIQVPTVHICSTPLKKLPFDVRNWNAIPHGIGQTHMLIGKLAKRLRSVIDT